MLVPMPMLHAILHGSANSASAFSTELLSFMTEGIEIFQSR
jgi:hypothetical protein